MEFKLNFIFEIFIDAVYYFSLFFFFKIIFQFTNSLGEFNQDAVIIFLITLYLADSLYVFFLGGNVFNINNSKGLTEFLSGQEIENSDLIHMSKIDNLCIISSGIVSASTIGSGLGSSICWVVTIS